jgi:hypothetical protein
MVLEDFREPLIGTYIAKGYETSSYKHTYRNYSTIVVASQAHIRSNGLCSASTPDSASA